MADNTNLPLDLETSFAELEARLFSRLEVRVGKSLTDIARIYVPALRRLGLSDLMAFVDTTLNSKDYEAARKIAHQAMTPEELTEEKAKLATLLGMMADSNAQRVQLAREVLNSGIVLAIRSVISLAAGGL